MATSEDAKRRAEKKFVEDTLVRKEAAKPDKEGNLPPGRGSSGIGLIIQAPAAIATIQRGAVKLTC